MVINFGTGFANNYYEEQVFGTSVRNKLKMRWTRRVGHMVEWEWRLDILI